MQTFILVIHIILAITLVGTVLLQRSEGGALGVGGGSGGFISSRGAANLLTRTTAILAAGFMVTSLILTMLGGQERRADSILEELSAPQQPVANEPVVPFSE